MSSITKKDAVMAVYTAELERLDAPKGRSLTQDALRRLAANKAALVSIIVLAAIVVIALAGPHLVPWDVAGVTQYIDTPLDPGTYYYRSKGFNDDGIAGALDVEFSVVIS